MECGECSQCEYAPVLWDWGTEGLQESIDSQHDWEPQIKLVGLCYWHTGIGVLCSYSVEGLPVKCST